MTVGEPRSAWDMAGDPEAQRSAPTYRVVAIPGDGIGPEVIAAGRRVLDAVGVAMGFAFEWRELIVGGRAIDDYGVSIRERTWPSAPPPTLSTWAPSVAPSGTTRRPPSAPSRRSSRFGAAWACMPTCGR